MSLADLITASAIAGAIDSIRFDKVITSFEFSPSIGIVAKRLAEFAEELEDTREPLQRSVRDVMTVSILENFMSSGRPKWEELAEATKQKRAKENAGSMILVRTGTLADAASSEGIWSIGKTTAAVRKLPEKAWYGNIHQAGHEGGALGGGNWFKKYREAAKKVLGPEATKKEIDTKAYELFDLRQKQHGPAPAGSSSIPARPFIMFQDEDIDAIENIFVDWIEEKIQEAGLR